VLGLVLAGDVKSTTVADQQRDLFALLANELVRELDQRALVIDLRTAALVDSLGLNLIIALLRWARDRNLPLAIELAGRGVYLPMLAVGLDRQAKLRFQEPKAAARSETAS
jgi:anti-anti-sigma regulatory factor